MSKLFYILKKLHYFEFLSDESAAICMDSKELFQLFENKITLSRLSTPEKELIANFIDAKRKYLELIASADAQDLKSLESDARCLVSFGQSLEANHKLLFPKLSFLENAEILKNTILSLSETLNKFASVEVKTEALDLLKNSCESLKVFSSNDVKSLKLAKIIAAIEAKSFKDNRALVDEFSLSDYQVYLAYLHYLGTLSSDFLRERLYKRCAIALMRDNRVVRDYENQLKAIFTKCQELNLVKEHSLGEWLSFMYMQGRFPFNAFEQLWLCDCYSFYLHKQNKKLALLEPRYHAIANFFDYLRSNAYT